MNHTVLYYQTADNKVIVEEWLNSLRDVRVQASILRRIDRMKLGNFGAHRTCRSGVSELKIDFGPGYRIYYSEIEKTIVLLLCSGDKSTQEPDIKRAIAYLKDFKERTK